MDPDLKDRIVDFSMPSVPVGTAVLWYPMGRRSAMPMVAYVLHCGARTTQLYLASGRRMDAVRHLADPKLELNSDQRENGAWDFTEQHKEFISFREEMERRLAALEKSEPVSAPAKPKKKPGNPAAKANLQEYRELQRQAQRLGINPTQKKVELKEAIAARLGQESKLLTTPEAINNG